MALEEITHYTCVWDIDDRKGYVGFFDDDGNYKGGNDYTEPMEFLAVLNILRYEKPLYFDTENQWLLAGVKFDPTISAEHLKSLDS